MRDGGEWSLPLSYSHFDDLMHYSVTRAVTQARRHTCTQVAHARVCTDSAWLWSCRRKGQI